MAKAALKPLPAAEAPAPAFTVLPAPAPAPSASPFKKLNLTALAKPAGKASKTYPVLADPDGDVAELARDILDQSAQLEALEGALDLAKREMRALAVPQYFGLLHGRGEIPSAVEALTADGRKLRVGFNNSYAALADETPLMAILGEHAATLLRQKITFKVDCDKVPEAALEPLYAEITALFAKHRATEALTATSGIVPTKDFHTLRHTLLTVEQNTAFDRVCPIKSAVKVKGLGNAEN